MTGSTPAGLERWFKSVRLGIGSGATSSKGFERWLGALSLLLWNLIGASFGRQFFSDRARQLVLTVSCIRGGQLLGFLKRAFFWQPEFDSGESNIVFGKCHTKVEALTTAVSRTKVFGSTSQVWFITMGIHDLQKSLKNVCGWVFKA